MGQVTDLTSISRSDFIGYAILKNIVFQAGSKGYAILESDGIKGGSHWYVFESVVRSPRHDNNYVHMQRTYDVHINEKPFTVKGNLYCQQNAITNVCAHVALRTALSAILPETDISYSEMNTILGKNHLPHELGDSLNYDQIKSIIEEKGFSLFKMPFNDPNYPQPPFPHHKFIYAGIESGWPVLLGFHFGQQAGHIIPILGHTFNEDTWVPNADTSYFQIGQSTRFISSETWVSTYIGHDDNFGSNFCIPRNYLETRQLLVIIIAPKECKYHAIKAEAIAIDYLYSIVADINYPSSNFWTQKLITACGNGRIVLRAVLITKDEYIDHLRSLKGWNSNAISRKLIDSLSDFLSRVGNLFWMVEFSHPELFPANHRKLGEILLNATVSPQSARDYQTFVLARLPDNFYLSVAPKPPAQPFFINIAHNINDHVKIYSKE